VGFFAIYIKN